MSLSNATNLDTCFFVIDDSIADLHIFEVALEQIFPDSTRKCFEGGHELLSFLENPLNQCIKPAAIFVDLNMPEMDGKEVLRLLRLNKNMNSPIYILSGALQEELKAELISLGAKEVFEKPTDYYEILDLFSKVLNPELILK